MGRFWVFLAKSWVVSGADPRRSWVIPGFCFLAVLGSSGTAWALPWLVQGLCLYSPRVRPEQARVLPGKSLGQEWTMPKYHPDQT